MKTLSGHTKTKVVNFLGGILCISLGTSFTPTVTELVTKREDSVAYKEALHELKMHMLADDILDTNIDEQLKVFDNFSVPIGLEDNRRADAKSNTKLKERATLPAPIESEKGWYFMFDK